MLTNLRSFSTFYDPIVTDESNKVEFYSRVVK
jgi:hypothetical protein